MSKLLRLSLVGLFLLGCTAHVPRATPAGGESEPPLQPPEWRAAAPSSRPPVLRKPTPQEGVLVGSLVMPTKVGALAAPTLVFPRAMPTKELSKLHCGWEHLRFRGSRSRADGPSFDESLIKVQPEREQFHGEKEEGELFTFTLPAGSYEIYSAVVVCIESDNVRRRYPTDQRFSIEFEVLPGKLSYLGELTFSPTPVSLGPNTNMATSGASVLIRNQWHRDIRLLENNYPLVDWSETVMSIPLRGIEPTLAEAPLPRRQERLLEEPLTSGASKQELEKACATGSGEGCFDLGLLVWKGRSLPRDERQAASFFAKACEGGIGQGCYNLGTFHLQRWAVKNPTLGRALELFDKACKRGTAWGCLSLGKMYEADGGTFFVQDIKKAASIYQQSCREGVAEGCFDLGMLYFKQQAMAGNKRRASSFFEQSCAKGYPRACIAAAQLQDE